MLKSFRERTKAILWIVVLAFVISIFALWGMDLRTPERSRGESDVVGSVDGEDISYQTYQNALNQLWTQMKEERGEEYEPSEIERNMLADQAWELAVQGRLMSEEIRKLDITVSDEELVAFLRKNPHPQLVKTFSDEEGQFDYQSYLRALADPEVDWTELERWGRAVIPEVKFQTYLLSQAHVPESDVLDRFKERTTTMRAQYVEIPVPAADPSAEVPEPELRALYEEKKEGFKEPAMRRIRVIEIEKKASPADDEDAAARLADIRAEIAGGSIDFATAAEENSDDGATASKGGDLGFIKQGSMDPEFDRVAFSLRPGEISEPFKSARGWHIVKLEERRTAQGAAEARVRHVLVEVEPGADTIDSLSTFIRRVTETIRDDGFEQAASKLSLPVREIEPFAQGMFVKDIGFVPRIVSFAFGNKAGSTSFPIETASTVYFVKVVEEIPERTRPFEDVRERLLADARLARADAAAKARADAARKDMIANGFEAGARAHGLDIQTTPQFKRMDQIPGVGGNTAFSTACWLLPLGAVSPPVKGQGRYHIIKLVERSELDVAAYGQARAGLVDEMRNEIASRFMANWYQGIRDKAKIEDLREKRLQ
jgi:peptidyl-prolyl cis-trans isomerase D